MPGKQWMCSNCGNVITSSSNPNSRNQPCPKCRLAFPLITWIEM